MTTTGFTRSLPPVLVYEGGKVDDPRDPGGRTNQGVIQRVYDGWRKANKKPPQDVYKMTAPERDAIYRRQYWDAVQGDKLPEGVDFVVFDGAVNSGPSQSIKWLQRALAVEADGVIGLVTLAAVGATADHDELIDKIVDRREAFLRALRTFKTFGKGWIARTTNVRALGKAWASGEATTTIPKVVKPKISEKAVVTDATKAPDKGLGDAATGAGVVAGGLGGMLQTLQQQLTPFSIAGGWIGKLVVALIIIGGVLALGGLTYRWWAGRKKATSADALDTPTVSP